MNKEELLGAQIAKTLRKVIPAVMITDSGIKWWQFWLWKYKHYPVPIIGLREAKEMAEKICTLIEQSEPEVTGDDVEEAISWLDYWRNSAEDECRADDNEEFCPRCYALWRKGEENPKIGCKRAYAFIKQKLLTQKPVVSREWVKRKVREFWYNYPIKKVGMGRHTISFFLKMLGELGIEVRGEGDEG